MSNWQKQFFNRMYSETFEWLAKEHYRQHRQPETCESCRKQRDKEAEYMQKISKEIKRKL